MTKVHMPIKVTPYRHQQEAFEFACRLFGLMEGGEDDGKNSSTVPSMRKDDSTIPINDTGT